MKKVLYVVIGILLLYLFCCIIGPSETKVERSATINAPIDSVRPHLVDYNLFRMWSPWAEKDSTMKMTIEGEAGKVGHKYSWEGSRRVGKGSLEISVIGHDTIAEKLVFEGRGESDVIFVLKSNEKKGTDIHWTITMKNGFFGRGMMLVMNGKMNEMFGEDFDLAIKKLKTYTEAKQVTIKLYKGYKITDLSWDEKTYFGKKADVDIDKLSSFLSDNFSKIKAELKKNKIDPIGAPSCIYFSENGFGNTTQCAVVYEIEKGLIVKGLTKFVIPASRVLQIIHLGDFTSKKGAPHLAMEEYMKEKGLTQTLVIEEYITTRMTEKDPSKWQTNIYYLVK